MAQSVASSGPNRMELFTGYAKTGATWIAIAGIALLIGMFALAPARQQAQPHYMPSSFVGLPTGMVTLTGGDGNGLILPVRVADTSSARMTGFKDVGVDALDNQFLLYAQTREMTNRTSYTVENVRAPLELAAIDAEGNLVSITTSTTEQTRVTVTDPHRWILAAKVGTFAHYGIEPGMTIDPESIQKINL